MKFGSIRAVGQVIATGSISSATTTILTGSSQLTNLGYAITGSNTFTGTQTMAGSIIPSTNNTYDLGSPTYQFRHVYISSGSLYVNGTKVLGSTAQELQITTDVGQSFKILEAGSDTITLQSADGNITIASSGGGDTILDPNTGVIALKGTTTVYSGYKIVSSDGNAIQFGNGIAITGSIVATGTSLVSGSSQITFSGLSGVPSGLVSGSSQVLSGTGIISSSAQQSGFGYATTGSNTFQGAQTINGSLNVVGNLTAQQFIVSSSVTYLTESFASGSHKFGDSSDDYHDFTGSVRINGTLVSTSTTLISGSSQVSYTGLTNIPSGIVSGSAQLPSGTVSGSSQVLNGTTIHSGSFFNGVSVVSGSAQIDVMSTTNIARLATTGSNTFNGLIAIGGANDGAGTLYITASSSTNAARLRNNDASYGTLDVLNSNASGIGVYAVASKHFISGSLGINTTSPGDVIDIRKNQNATTNFYFRNTDTTNASSRAYLNVVAGDTTMSMLALHGGDTYLAGTAGRNMYFQQNPGGAVNMFISGSGGVGVGTTNPFNKMTIHTGTGNNLDIFDTGASFGIGMQAVNDVNTVYKSWDFYASKFNFLNGNVGINTTAPGLQTNGTGLVISSNTTQFPVLRLERLTGGGGGKTVTNWEWVINSSGGLTLQNQSDAYEPFVMENTTGTATLSGDLYANKSANVARYTRVNGLYEYVKDGPYTSSNTTVSVVRQFHDAANWCNGGILVEITCHGYATSEFDHAVYFVRYGYGGNSTSIDTRLAPITNRITAPYWGSATNISGNDYYRDLLFDTQAYRVYKIVLKTNMTPTTNSTGAGQGNYVYLFGY
jgi:hypothetical protein